MESEKRQFKRFKVNTDKLVGRLDQDQTVDIVDMSVGGAALHARRRLAVGNRYAIRLENPDGGIDVLGVVVRSRMTGIGETYHGERVPVYSAALQFHEGSEEQLADFICGSMLA